jgi:hypothetical protein
VVLRSGACFTLEAQRITTKRNTATGELTELSWRGLTGTAPLYMRLDAIDAVLQLEEEGTA